MENPSTSGQASPADERLDSWKEIAAYLKRSVRGVQRWEAEEGMPVHRHRHDKRGTIFAFKHELDAWWRERGALLADENGAEKAALASTEHEPAVEIERHGALEAKKGPKRERTVSTPVSGRRVRAVLLGTGFAIAVGLVFLVAWLFRNGPSRAGQARGTAFHARDWVLVASFENRTGEKLFDETLDYTLARELSNSRFVQVAPRERVEDALRLMRKPLDARLDATLAREVCLRDGEIRAFVTGRAEKLGANYVFSAELVDPKQGTTLTGFTEEGTGPESSLAAMRRISARVRSALGEAPAAGDVRPTELARVTTSKLKALQLYSRADSLMARDNNQAAAEKLLRQAVAEDPTFASAWMHLAWVLYNQERPAGDFLPYAETALSLAETTTDRERYFIQGSYHQLLGQREKAIAAYEALLSLHPDHRWAVGNLASLYRWQDVEQELEKVVQVEARFADSRPRDFAANWNAGYDFLVRTREPARARPYLRRASELVTLEHTEAHPNSVAWLDLLPFTENWLNGDLRAAASEIDRVASKLDSLGGRARDRFALATALGYLTLGRIEDAARTSGRIAEPLVRNDMLAQLAFIRGDVPALRRYLEFRGDRQSEGVFPLLWWETTSILQARVGLTSEARSFLKAQRLPRLEDQSTADSPELHTVPGEIALAQGNLTDAMAEFEQAMKLFDDRSPKKPGFYLCSESLAATLAGEGDLDRAIRVLERTSDKVNSVITGTTAAYWLRNRLELARLYRGVGRVGDARGVEAGLSKLLALADSNHPILVELRRPRRAETQATDAGTLPGR